MANGHVADQTVKHFAIENLRHQPHAPVHAKLFAVARDNAGAFLPAMLQRVKAVVREFGGIRMTENAEHAAIMFGVMLHATECCCVDRSKRALVWHRNFARSSQLTKNLFTVMMNASRVWFSMIGYELTLNSEPIRFNLST